MDNFTPEELELEKINFLRSCMHINNLKFVFSSSITLVRQDNKISTKNGKIIFNEEFNCRNFSVTESIIESSQILEFDTQDQTTNFIEIYNQINQIVVQFENDWLQLKQGLSKSKYQECDIKHFMNKLDIEQKQLISQANLLYQFKDVIQSEITVTSQYLYNVQICNSFLSNCDNILKLQFNCEIMRQSDYLAVFKFTEKLDYEQFKQLLKKISQEWSVADRVLKSVEKLGFKFRNLQEFQKFTTLFPEIQELFMMTGGNYKKDDQQQIKQLYIKYKQIHPRFNADVYDYQQVTQALKIQHVSILQLAEVEKLFYQYFINQMQFKVVASIDFQYKFDNNKLIILNGFLTYSDCYNQQQDVINVQQQQEFINYLKQSQVLTDYFKCIKNLFMQPIINTDDLLIVKSQEKMQQPRMLAIQPNKLHIIKSNQHVYYIVINLYIVNDNLQLLPNYNCNYFTIFKFSQQSLAINQFIQQYNQTQNVMTRLVHIYSHLKQTNIIDTLPLLKAKKAIIAAEREYFTKRTAFATTEFHENQNEESIYYYFAKINENDYTCAIQFKSLFVYQLVAFAKQYFQLQCFVNRSYVILKLHNNYQEILNFLQIQIKLQHYKLVETNFSDIYCYQSNILNNLEKRLYIKMKVDEKMIDSKIDYLIRYKLGLNVYQGCLEFNEANKEDVLKHFEQHDFDGKLQEIIQLD